MLRIALCDDDAQFLSVLQRKIESWFQKNEERHYNVFISRFSSSEYFASVLKENYFDIVFLDIEMPKLDGMKLARIVREQMPHSIIIFLTSYDEFAPDGYKVQALRYISKLNLSQQLGEALTAATKEFSKLETGYLPVITYGNLNRIPYHDIIYVRHVLRYSEITTESQGVIRDHRGIKELHELVKENRFIFIDRGTFVNLDYVQSIKAGRIILLSSESLVISRRMLSQVKLMINQILGG